MQKQCMLEHARQSQIEILHCAMNKGKGKGLESWMQGREPAERSCSPSIVEMMLY